MPQHDPSKKQLAAGWRDKGAAKLSTEEEKRLQAALMLSDRIAGDTLAQIARKYNLSIETVRERLKLARRERLLDGAADRVLDQLVPAAQNAYLRVLSSEDDELALRAAEQVLYGTGILSKQNRPVIAPPDLTPAAKVETLDDYRRLRQEQGKGGVAIVDAEVIELDGSESDALAESDDSALLAEGPDDARAEGALPAPDAERAAEAPEGAAPGDAPRTAFAPGSAFLG